MSPNVYSHFVLNLCIPEFNLSQSLFHPCLPYVAVKGGTSERPVGRVRRVEQLPQEKSIPHSASLQTGLGECDITATIRRAHWLWEREAGKYGGEGRAIPGGLWNKPEMGPEWPHRLESWSSLGYLCNPLHGMCMCVYVYHGRNQAPHSYRLQRRFRSVENSMEGVVRDHQAWGSHQSHGSCLPGSKWWWFWVMDWSKMTQEDWSRGKLVGAPWDWCLQ